LEKNTFSFLFRWMIFIIYGMGQLHKILLSGLLVCTELTFFAQEFEQLVKITANERGSSDHFGYASCIDGNWAIVGSHWEDEDENDMSTLDNAGAAYVYSQSPSGVWIQSQKLVSSDRSASDYFGWSVAISGNYAIIGAYWDDEDAAGSNTMDASGAAYIFEMNADSVWVEVQKITASDRWYGAWFGYEVRIDNDRALVGAHREDKDTSGGNELTDSGAAYIFERGVNGVWSEVGKLVASDRQAEDWFGQHLAISGDVALVGASEEDEDENGGNNMNSSGSVYVFERDEGGSWNQTQKLVASNRAAFDQFGWGLAVSGDQALISAPAEDDDADGLNSLSSSGSLFVFERQAGGMWLEIQKLVAFDRSAFANFGWAVAVSEDMAVVSAINEAFDLNGENEMQAAGAGYILNRDEGGVWSVEQKIVPNVRGALDYFASGVGISGNWVVASAYWEDEDSADLNYIENAGSAYLFSSGDNPTRINTSAPFEFSVGPNPTSGKLNILLPEIAGKYSVQLLTLSGDKVWSGTCSGILSTTLNITGPAGVYLLEVSSPQGFMVMTRIVKY
jgi:hypothetical protein